MTNKTSFEKLIEFEELLNEKKEPITRYYHSSVLYKDSIFIFGGCYFEFSLNDLFEYKIETKEWIKYEYKSNLVPPNMIQSSLNYYNDHLFIIGGRDNCYFSSNAYSSLWKFNLQEMKWEEIKNLLKIYLHSSILVNDSIYIFGGFDGDNLLNNFKRLNLKNLNLKDYENDLISSRYGASLYFDNQNLIFIFGGNDLNSDLNDLYSFDINNQLFKKIELNIIAPNMKFHYFFKIENNFISILNENIYIFNKEEIKKIKIENNIRSSTYHFYNSNLFCILGKNSLDPINKFLLDI